MPRPANPKPKLKRGYWTVRIHGRDHHLGKDPHKATVKFHRMMAEKLTPNNSLNPTVDGLVATYFIQAGDRGPIKIGKSTAPDRRLTDLQGACPYRLRLLCTLGRDMEAELHRRFDNDRLHGEWFEPTNKLLAFIARQRYRNAAAELAGAEATFGVTLTDEQKAPPRVAAST